MKEIKEPIDVLIFEIVKRYHPIRKYALISEVKRLSRQFLGEKRKEDAIRKRIDGLVKNGVLIREGRRKEAYIQMNPSARIDPTIKPFSEEISKFIRIERENASVMEERRGKHTDKIKRNIIKPWINLLEERKDLAEIKKGPYFRDLDNHIPQGVENPTRILAEYESEKREYRKCLDEFREKLNSIICEILKSKNQKIAVEDETKAKILETGWCAREISENLFEWIVRELDRKADDVLRHLNTALNESLRQMKFEETTVKNKKQKFSQQVFGFTAEIILMKMRYPRFYTR